MPAGAPGSRHTGGFSRFLRALGTGLLLACTMLPGPAAEAGWRDKLREYRQQQRAGGSSALDPGTIAAGLKEALQVGAQKSVSRVSAVNGYFGDPLIRIPLPEKVQGMERLMRKAGFGKEVDQFLLSMNRAAENAAPQALGIFVDAVKQMTIPDASRILRGNDTAATEYLRAKTYGTISVVFLPIVSSAMNETGVARTFKTLMDKARRIPMLKQETVDLDQYVTGKALDGLFLAVGQEERKIRKDPGARVTELLKKVFHEDRQEAGNRPEGGSSRCPWCLCGCAGIHQTAYDRT
jgi:hypothetical protein